MAIEYHLLTEDGTSGSYWASLSASQKNRYSDGIGGYRVWDAIGTWCDSYMIVDQDDGLTKDVVLEVQGAWTDTSQTANWLHIRRWKSVTITCKINGVDDPDSHHYGVSGGGWKNSCSVRTGPHPYNIPSSHIYGLEFYITNTDGLRVGSIGTIISCIVDAKLVGIKLPPYGFVCNNVSRSRESNAYYELQDTYAVAMFNLAHNSPVGFLTYQGRTDNRAVNSAYIGNIAYNNTINFQTHTTTQQQNTRYIAIYNMGDSNDLVTVTFSNTGGVLTVNLAAHDLALNAQVRFIDGGSATAPTGLSFGTKYYVKAATTDTFTLSETVGGAEIAYSDSGSGTIQYSYVWDTENLIAGYVSSGDFSDLTSGSEDFSPYSSSSNQVNVIPQGAIEGLVDYDMAGNIRPNYEPSSNPDEYIDAGPLEYDHGNGLAPVQATVTIAAQVSLVGAEVRIYDNDGLDGDFGTEIDGVESHTSATYSYTDLLNNEVIIQIMQDGYKEYVQSFLFENTATTLNVTLKADLAA